MTLPELLTHVGTGPSPVSTLFKNIRPRRIRTFAEFAEQEIRLPDGPRQNLMYSLDFMPWAREIFTEFDGSGFRRFFASGPAQSGKTLHFFLIPLMYHLFEVGENVIVGCPDVDMAQSIWNDRIAPMIRASRFVDEIPEKGAGSRGGKFKSITFASGVTLRFMGAGGGDGQRSSHTARVVILTEVDKMDTAGASSREADPVTQIEARTNAFGERGRIYAECTMSHERGRIFNEVCKYGSNTLVFIPCNHCGEHVAPERDSLKGWQDASNVMQAREQAGFYCPECGAEWSDEDRARSIDKPALVHEGQEVDKAGNIDGEAKATDTLGLRWNAMHSRLVRMADIAEKEYKADISDKAEDKRGVLQFIWALPYADDLLDLSDVSRDMVLGKIGNYAQGMIPREFQALTVFIDVGLYRCWWVAIAWMDDTRGHIVDYGQIEVFQGREKKDSAILAALRNFRDDTINQGWQVEGDEGKVVTPEVTMVDSGYKPEVVYMFVKESGQGRYYASKGLGSGRNMRQWSAPKAAKGRMIGNNSIIAMQEGGIKLVEMHADYWKTEVHQGFAAPEGTPGAITLYKAERNEHKGFAKQVCAEVKQEIYEPGKGTKIIWDVKDKNNHYLDCVYGARVAAEWLGVSLVAKKPVPKRKKQAKASGHKIRTRY